MRLAFRTPLRDAPRASTNGVRQTVPGLALRWLSRALVRCAPILVLAIVARPVLGQQGVGAGECCLPMLLGHGARAVALGTALTARPGPDGLFANPASMIGVRQSEFRVHNAKTDIETTNTFALAFKRPTVGTLGLSYRLADYGETERTDDVGNPLGTVRLLEGVVRATFATTLGGGLSTGISYVFYHLNLPDVVAVTHGVDFGAQYHPPTFPSVQLGASLVNAGLPLQVFNKAQAAPLPARVRFGAAYELMHHFSSDSTTRLWTSADVAASWHHGVPVEIGGGAEFVLDNTIFLRAGYVNGTSRAAGASTGVGLRYQRFDIGIAKSFAGEASGGTDPYQITFAITF